MIDVVDKLEGKIDTAKPDVPEDEQRLVERLEEDRRNGEAASRKRVGDCELNLAFLSGNQWLYWSHPHGLQPIENETDEERVTDNRMLPTYLRWMADLFEQEPVLDVYEGGTELHDAEAARAATTVCEFWHANNGWKQARREAASWMLPGAVSFIAPVWRKYEFAAKRQRRRLAYNESATRVASGRLAFLSETVEEETTGDVAFQIYDPLQTYLFPLDAHRWSDIERILVVSVEGPEWVKRNTELAEAALSPLDETLVYREAVDRVNRYVSPEFGLSAKTGTGKRYLVMQLFENPSADHRDGRYVMVVGGRVARDEALPYIEEGREIDPLNANNLWMGLVPHWSGYFPGRLYPPAPLTICRAAQKNINDIATDARQNRRSMRRNKLIIERDSLDEEAWTDEINEVIELAPGTSMEPHFVQAPTMAGLDADRSAAEYSYAESTGQTEASRGQNPTYVRSAWHYSLAERTSRKILAMMVECAEESFAQTAKLAMAIAKRRYDLERIVEVVGRDRTAYALAFGTACLRTDLRIRPGSLTPRNHEIIVQQLTELMRDGLFDDQKMTSEGRRVFFEQLELGVLPSLADEDLQRHKAEDENLRMAVYLEPVRVSLADDDDVHIAAHRRFMTRREYWERCGLDVQAVFETHLEAHISSAASKAAPDAEIPTEPIAGVGREGLPTGATPPTPANASLEVPA
jgi:hypothetical protein